MDGFIAQEHLARRQACTVTQDPSCGQPGSTDVMGYHDAHEIPNYWQNAQQFVLQDRMFEPNASWSLPAHLFTVSAWSARCPNSDPMSCTNNVQLPSGTAYLLAGPVRGANFPKPEYSWTDVTYLLHQAGVTWAYYLDEGAEPDCEDDAMFCNSKPQSVSVPVRSATLVFGDRQGAQQYFEQALDVSQRLRYRPEAALVHLELGEMLLAERDSSGRSEALAHLDFAISEMAEMHMRPHLERAVSLQGQMHARPASAPNLLSSRECEVAALVARGLSNRAIAEALVISEGTAEVHVKSILSKLGFRSRAQIAVWAVESAARSAGG
jgi:DNA-binding CsgD family transcriptional regulator